MNEIAKNVIDLYLQCPGWMKLYILSQNLPVFAHILGTNAKKKVEFVPSSNLHEEL